MKTIDTHGITYIEPVPEGTSEWYYGISYEHGDLYEAEEVFLESESVLGNSLCLIHYPDGEVFWPEQVHFPMGQHESFFLRDGEKLYFSKWYEEGDGPDYRYWEEIVNRDLNGNLIETLPGDVRVMPNGDIWHLTGTDDDWFL